MSNALSGLPIEKIQKCMGDPEADVDNEVLKLEQDSQVRFLFQVMTNDLFENVG